MPWQFRDAAGQLKQSAADLVGSDFFTKVKLAFGVDGSYTDVSAANPLPTREPPRSALGRNASPLSPASDTQIAAQNPGRTFIEVSNGMASGLWLTFGGGAAVVGRGTYLPAKTAAYWYTQDEVRGIVESGGSASAAVGYTEW